MRTGRVSLAARTAVAALIGLLLPAGACRGQESRYTSLAEDACLGDAGGGLSPESDVEECPAPDGVRLFLVFEGERSSLTIVREGRDRVRTRDAIYNNPAIGYFPNIDRASPAEWRYGRNGRLRGLIFRVDSQSRVDSASWLSQLLVVRLGEERSCILGPFAASEEARDLVDTIAAHRPVDAGC